MENETTLPMHNDGIRTVAPGRGVEWLVGGFTAVFKTPGVWIVGGLILMLCVYVSNFIPFIGGALVTALYIVASGAAMRACAAIDGGRDPVADAKQALSSQPLLILAAIAGGLSLVLTLVLVAMITASVGAAMMVSGTLGMGMALISTLLTTMIYIVMFMALWLAPGLVMFKNMQPLDAMKLSLKATLKNLVAYIVLAILSAVAFVIGSIPMGLGLLIVLPAAMCASYLAYRELFA